MDHKVSIATHAAEKYLLGELPPDQLEAFEEHFFDCPECAEEVRLAFAFRDNAKVVLSQPFQTAPTWRERFAALVATLRPAMALPLAACLALVTFSGYQNTVEIPSLRVRVASAELPRVLSPVVLAPSARSAVPTITIPANASTFQLSLITGAIPTHQSSAGQYRCDLRSNLGKTLVALPIPKLDPDNLVLSIPASPFPGGYYDAVLIDITSGSAKDIEHFRFAIRRE